MKDLQDAINSCSQPMLTTYF